MAAPSASPPLLQAEGSVGRKEFLTNFAHYRRNFGPYLPLLVDPASPDRNFSCLPSPIIQEVGPHRGLFAKEEVTAPGRATQSVARIGAVTDDARRRCRVTAAKSLSEKDPVDPRAHGHWFRIGGSGGGYQEVAGPPEEGGASKVAKEVGRRGRWGRRTLNQAVPVLIHQNPKFSPITFETLAFSLG